MLCAIDLIGVSELLISCESTRTIRCQPAVPLRAAPGSDPRRRAAGAACRRGEVDGAPRSGPSRETAVDRRRGTCRRPDTVEPSSGARRPSSSPTRCAEQPLPGRVHQHEAFLGVEGEHRDVDRLHDARQERGRFHRLGALPLQRVAERVDLRMTRSTALPGARASRRGSSSPLRAARRAGSPRRRARA